MFKRRNWISKDAPLFVTCQLLDFISAPHPNPVSFPRPVRSSGHEKALSEPTPPCKERRPSWPRHTFAGWRAGREEPEVPESREPGEPSQPLPLSTAFGRVTTGAGLGAEEAAAAGSGEETERHEAAQARSVTRVGTVRAGPGWGEKVQYPPPLLPLRPRGLCPSPPGPSLLPRVGTPRSPGWPALRFAGALPCAGRRPWRGGPLAGRGSWGFEIPSQPMFTGHPLSAGCWPSDLHVRYLNWASLGLGAGYWPGLQTRERNGSPRSRRDLLKARLW